MIKFIFNLNIKTGVCDLNATKLFYNMQLLPIDRESCVLNEKIRKYTQSFLIKTSNSAATRLECKKQFNLFSTDV